jgi:hypothetical protein
MDQSLERWRPVVGLEDRYEVSDHGRVRSLSRATMRGNVMQRVRGRVIAQQPLQSRGGNVRLKVTLITPAGRSHRLVHRLVAEAFCAKGDGCDVVNHIDNNATNNHWTNLEWTTVAGNNLHMRSQGRAAVPVLQGSQNPCAKHSEAHAMAVIAALKAKEPRRQIATRLGVSTTFVAEIACGRRWKHLPR